MGNQDFIYCSIIGHTMIFKKNLKHFWEGKYSLGRIRGGKEKTGKGKVDRREESLSEIRRNRRISPAQPNTHLYFFYYLLSKRADFGGTRDCHVF